MEPRVLSLAADSQESKEVTLNDYPAILYLRCK